MNSLISSFIVFIAIPSYLSVEISSCTASAVSHLHHRMSYTVPCLLLFPCRLSTHYPNFPTLLSPSHVPTCTDAFETQSHWLITGTPPLLPSVTCCNHGTPLQVTSHFSSCPASDSQIFPFSCSFLYTGIHFTTHVIQPLKSILADVLSTFSSSSPLLHNMEPHTRTHYSRCGHTTDESRGEVTPLV